MGNKFKDVYRIESARRPNWDYSWDGVYFVTICTGGRGMYFGDIINGQMIFSDIGQKAYGFWNDIPEHFRFVRLDEFQIMPNHVHGLIEINHHLLMEEKIPHDKNVDQACVETANLDVSNNHLDVSNNPAKTIHPDNPEPASENRHNQITDRDETARFAGSTSVQPNENRYRTIAASEKWKPGTLGAIMNQYKRAVTIDARKINPEFYWQTRYYDRIVKDQNSLVNIRNYIRNNPKKWAKDELNPDNI